MASDKDKKDEDLADEAKAAMLARFRDPLILGYAVGFFGWNWRFFYTLAMPQNSPTKDVIGTAAALLNGKTYFIPLLIAAGWAFVLPFLSALGFLVRDLAAVAWEMRSKEMRERAVIASERAIKQLREGEALSAREWRKHNDYRILDAEARQGKTKNEALRRSLCAGWRKAWPPSMVGAQLAQVRVLSGPGNAGRFAVRDNESVKEIDTDFVQLSPSERTRVVYIFEYLSEASLAVVVETGGLAPWLHDEAGLLTLSQKGAVTTYLPREQAAADAIAVLRRCSAPHSDWGRFEVVQVSPEEATSASAAPKDV